MGEKIIFVALISMLVNLSFSQNLTYNDLKYLFENNIDDSNDYILKKGFEFYETETDENTENNSMIWSFKRNNDNDRAVAFISKYKFIAYDGFVWYQFNDVNVMNQIKAYCKSIGFKLKKSEIDKLNCFCSTYENSMYTIHFCSGINKETNRNTYTITFDNK